MTLYQPPEWAQHSSVWIGFPSAADLWLDDLEGAQAEIAAFALAVLTQGKGERVDLVCANAEAANAAKKAALLAAKTPLKPAVAAKPESREAAGSFM